MTFLVGKIQQSGQHPPRQLFRYRRHPVEGLVQRQAIEYLPCAPADQPFHFFQVLWRHYSLDFPTLHVMLGWIHGYEHLDRKAFRWITQNDLRLGGKKLVVLVNKQDVIIARYRPERPERTAFLIVHWRLITEPLEVGPPMALPLQKRVAGIDVFG